MLVLGVRATLTWLYQAFISGHRAHRVEAGLDPQHLVDSTTDGIYEDCYPRWLIWRPPGTNSGGLGLGFRLVLTTLLAAEKASNNGSSAIFQLVFFGAIFAAMYFLLLRPQRRRVRDAQGLQKSIAENDEVVLNSGVLGFVSAIDGDIVWLDIADGVEIRVLKSSIARKIDPSKESAGGQPLADSDEK